MIAKYNRKQKLLSKLNLLAAVFLSLFTFGFFYAAFFFISTSFDYPNPHLLTGGLSLAALLIVIITGVKTHHAGFGHYSYQESDLFTGLDYSDPGTRSLAYGMGVSGCSYLLTQTFLAAPLQWLQGLERLHSLIPQDSELEQKLQILLDEINGQTKWIPIKNFQNRSEEITYLIRMEAIQFSPRKSVIHRN